jgi:hypothetical protein
VGEQVIVIPVYVAVEENQLGKLDLVMTVVPCINNKLVESVVPYRFI